MEDQYCNHPCNSKMIDDPSDAPNYVRCPACNRRLKPQITNCHHDMPWTEPCWHYGIPPHKVKGYKIPKKSPNRKTK